MSIFKTKKKCLIITHDIWTFAMEYVVNRKVGLSDDFDVCINPNYEIADEIKEEISHITGFKSSGVFLSYDQAKHRDYDIVIRPMPINSAALLNIYKHLPDAEYIYVDAGRTCYEYDYFIKHVRGNERRILAKSRVFLQRPNIYPPAESIFTEDVFKVTEEFMQNRIQTLPQDVHYLIVTHPVYSDEKDEYKERIERFSNAHKEITLIKLHNRDDIPYSLSKNMYHNVFICPKEIPAQFLFRLYPNAIVYKGDEDLPYYYEPSIVHMMEED